MAIFNKNAQQGLDLSIHGPRNVRSATAWRLEAPALDSTEAVTLAGAEIREHAVWSPRVVETIKVSHGAARIHVPAASAALLLLD